METPTRPPAVPRGLGRVGIRPLFGMLFDCRPVRRADTYYARIDLLRGLAAVCVLLCHYQYFFHTPGPASAANPLPDYQHAQPLYAVFRPIYDYGQYAVQVFWMISGFVFAAVYADRRPAAGRFVAHRVARLYPLHLLTLLAMTGLQAVCRARHGAWWVYDNGWPYFLLQLAFASNWARHWPSSFNGPVWSVSVEVLVYAAFWLAVPRVFARGVVGPLVMAGLFSLLNVVRLNDLIGSCGIYFFIGAALYVTHDRWRDDRRSQLIVATLLVAAGAGGLAGGARTLLSVSALGGGAILALAALESTPLAGRAKPLRWIGDGTYGMYLWHTPIQLAVVLAWPTVATSGALSSPLFLAAFVGIVLLFGHLSFVGFERPLQRRLRSLGGHFA